MLCFHSFSDFEIWKETLFSCLHLPKFLMELLVYPVTAFCLGMPDFSHMYTELKTACDILSFLNFDDFFHDSST